ncbi:MAG TPA: hypothetical protein VMT63_12560 [Bacteroidales bacterium]|nr:hypothetical protein [Bacteroidales bacterium]
MFGANHKPESQGKSYHLVLICDEPGVFDTFRILKDNLWYRNDLFISLIYAIPEDTVNPLFEKELGILDKRYTHNLFICKLKTSQGECESIQVIIEAVINGNTNPDLRFSVTGERSFVEYVSGVLTYLNANADTVRMKIIP